MKRIREFFSDLSETVTVTKLDGVLIVAVSALAGMFLGMLCSPRKTTRWYNGNQIYHNGEAGELPGNDGADEESVSFR